MKFGPSELFRILAVFFMAMLLINFALVGYKVNESNDYQNAVSQEVAKNGGVTAKVLKYAKDLSDDKYQGMFSIKPAPNEYVSRKNINGDFVISNLNSAESKKKNPMGYVDKPVSGKTLTIDYSQTQNYGRPIKYVMDMHVPFFSLGQTWSKLGAINNTRTVVTTSEIAQHDLNREQEPY